MDVSKWNGKHQPFYANRSKNIKAKKEKLSAKKTFYNSVRWQKLRSLTLRTHPLCVRCDMVDEVVGAEVVDHVVLFVDSNDTLATDTDNLRSLCRKCHGFVSWDEERQGRELLKRYHDGEDMEVLVADKYKHDQYTCGEDGYPL